MTGGEDWAIRQVVARTANQVRRSRIAFVAPFEFVEHLLEDGAKFVGISLSLAYYLRTASALLAPVHDQAGTG